MLIKGFRAARCFACSFFITILTIFSGLNPIEANQMSSDVNDQNSFDILIEESSDALDGSKTSAAPDLGDDQAFPFIPGFGKNSGKD